MSDPDISLDDVAFSSALPEPWITASLQQIATLGFGQSPPSSTYNADGRGLPFFQGKAEFGDRFPTIEKWCTEPTRIAEAGDILMSIRAPVGPTNVAPATCGIGRGLASIRPHHEIPTDYVLYYLRHIAGRLATKGTGTTFGAITKPVVQGIQVPLAPVAMQARIASKIDELFSRIDEGERALARMQKLVERYRQSVLKAAVTGELTRNWREKNQHQLESGEALLARILKARRAAWEKAELDKMKAKGITPANDKWKLKYEEPVAPETTDLPELPEGWVWASLNQFAAPVDRAIQSGPFGSNLLHSEFQSEGKLVIGIDNVRDGWFSPGSQNRISDEKFEQLKKYAARPKDFLITVMATVGRTCVLPEDIEPAIITKHVYRFTLDQDLVIPEFVNLCVLGSPSVRAQMFGNVRGQTRPGLNKSILTQFGFPLPSLEEQRQILDQSAELTSQISENRKGLVMQTRLSNALRHSRIANCFLRRSRKSERCGRASL